MLCPRPIDIHMNESIVVVSNEGGEIMSAYDFKSLLAHVGHNIVCVTYGINETVNVSIECEDCNEVLVSFDSDE